MTELARTANVKTLSAIVARVVQPKEAFMFRKTLFALAAAGIVLTAAACNTVKGLGRDIESVGEAGDRAT